MTSAVFAGLLAVGTAVVSAPPAAASASVPRAAVVWDNSGVYGRPQYSGANLIKYKPRYSCVQPAVQNPVQAPDGRYWRAVELGSGGQGWMRADSLAWGASNCN